MTKYTRDLRASSAATAGGKAVALGEMVQIDIPIPPGFVVLTKAFEHFFSVTGVGSEIDLLFDSIQFDELASVESVSAEIRARITDALMPEDIAQDILEKFDALGVAYVAVRSSATVEDSKFASWAGQLDSFLNINREMLLHYVQECWASLYTPRALLYQSEKNIQTERVAVAVVIQQMVTAEKSGVTFSVHPMTKDSNQLIIEAVYGLGEALVSGYVTPDVYVVEKESRRIVESTTSVQSKELIHDIEAGKNTWVNINNQVSQRVLSETEIATLANLIVKIEDHFGFPCDIEWAQEAGLFYVVQSRPITTL